METSKKGVDSRIDGGWRWAGVYIPPIITGDKEMMDEYDFSNAEQGRFLTTIDMIDGLMKKLDLKEGWMGPFHFGEDLLDILTGADKKKEEGTKMSGEYGFWANRKNEFNYERVIQEVRHDTPLAVGFLLKSPGCPVAAVVLFQEFVDRFSWEDGFVVASEPLVNGYWGYDFKVALGGRVDKDCRNKDYDGTFCLEIPDDKGPVLVEDSYVIFVHVTEIERVLGQVTAARAYAEGGTRLDRGMVEWTKAGKEMRVQVKPL